MTTYKGIVKAAISGEEKNVSAFNWVKKAGGIENVTEEMAARIVKICRLSVPDASEEETAYQKAKEYLRGIKFLKGQIAAIGEAHDFGQMSGYDANGDERARARYEREIRELEAKLAEVASMATKAARMKGGKVWEEWPLKRA